MDGADGFEPEAELPSVPALPVQTRWGRLVSAAFGQRVVDLEEVVEIESDDGSATADVRASGAGLLAFDDYEEVKDELPSGDAVALKEGAYARQSDESDVSLREDAAGASDVQPSSALRAEFERKLVEAEAALARKRPALPWETGVMGRIFGARAKERKLLPIWLDDPRLDVEDEASSTGMASAPSASLLARRAPKELPLGWLQAKEKRRGEEVEKWLALLLLSPQGSEVGRLLEQKRREGNSQPALGRLLGGFLSSRDPLTLSRHRVAVEQYMAWRERVGQPRLLPSSLDDVKVYLDELWSTAAAGSRSIQFFKTCLFLGHVMGIGPLREADKSSVVTGFAAQARKRVKHRLKRRALTVAEVEKLESIVCDDAAELQSRIVAGALLCGLMARARWHELGAALRLQCVGSGLNSFVELEVGTVKTAAQHLRGKSTFFMVGAGHGVHAFSAWGPKWVSLRERAELRADAPGGVIESPAEGDEWLGCPMPVGRARSWMAHLLGTKDDQQLGTHSLKATLLSWANAAGLGDEQRRAMGYHSAAAGKKNAMIELYGRDAQAAAARVTSHLVGAVRRGLLCPDEQRGKQYPKGYSALASALDLGRVDSADPGDEEAPSSAESSEDGDSSLSEGASEGECAVDTELYAHRRLGTVHRVTAEGPRHFRCGRFNSSSMRQ